MKRQVVVASLIAFMVSFCVLVIELVAGRIMAPYVGASLYTWTSIIGVVLAGISLGAYLGGLLADRYPLYITLGLLLVASGLSVFAIQPIAAYVGTSDWFKPGGDLETTSNLAMMSRILLLTVIVFFVPFTIMGTITPVVVKLALDNLKTSGNVVGKIYAWATLGSIIGTFITGFYLIEAMSTTKILWLSGALMILCAPVFGFWFQGIWSSGPLVAAGRLAALLLFLGGSVVLFQGYVRWHYQTDAARTLADADKNYRTQLGSLWSAVFSRGDVLRDAPASGKKTVEAVIDSHMHMIRDMGIGFGCLLLAAVAWGLARAGVPTQAPAALEVTNLETVPIEPFRFAAPEDAGAKRALVLAGITTFVASFCILGIEIVAGRILAPHVGVSLYTWTSIIGVVLAGITVGAYMGGYLADKFPSHATLGWLFFIAGLITVSIPILVDTMGGGDFVKTLSNYYGITEFYGMNVPFIVKILMVTTAIFFVPSFVLGMVSPVVVKLSVDNLKKTGSTVGKIYAFSTFGSILGTFTTGFFLIELLGTRTILYSLAAVLVICAPVFGGLFRGQQGVRLALVGACVLILAGVLGLLGVNADAVARPFVKEDKQKWDEKLKTYVVDHVWNEKENKYETESYYTQKPLNQILYKETDYYTIKVRDDTGYYSADGKRVPIHTLVLDHLVHSYTHIEKPLYLKYDYLKIYEELVAWRTRKKPANDYLFVGGGGYTLPRFFDAMYPQSRIDVIEIDPWVSKVAQEKLGVAQTRIHTINMDGRWFAMNSKKKYDYIFGDAFNDLSIPYHLTTLEFDNQLKGLLNPDGLLMALVIDSIKDGEFLPTYIRTMQESFGKDKVHLIVLEDADVDDIGHETCIVVACQEKLDFDDFNDFMRNRMHPDPEHKGEKYDAKSHVVTLERLQSYLADTKKRGRKPMVLTDDYVPADNLIAKLFNERFSFKKKGAD